MGGLVVVVDGFSMGAVLAGQLAARVSCVHVLSDERYLARFAGGEVPDIYTDSFILGRDGDVKVISDALATYGPAEVVAGSEWGVWLAEALAVGLGVPTNSAGGTHLRRNKFDMVEAAGAAGLAVAAQAMVTDGEQAAHWMVGLGLERAVAKPLESAASDNVFICDSPASLGAAVSTIRASRSVMLTTNEKVVVQQFLDGTEYVVNTVSGAGEDKVSEVWRVTKYLSDEGRNLYDFDDLCDPVSADAKDVIDYVRRLLPVLGMVHGAGHTEVMRGTQGVRLIESAARVSGAANPQAIRVATGNDQIGLLVDLLTRPAAFREAPEVYPLLQSVRCVHLMTGVRRVFSHARTLAFLQTLPTFSNIVFRSRDGAQLEPTVDVATCPGAFFLVAASSLDIHRDYLAFRAWELSLDRQAQTLEEAAHA
ncbi:MAG TPA: ATP-grasp domain-containing protein [Luteibacter sp.]|jgi:biotin carboxylase|uniref:ATP-grasp domain-containing protein n=1 Tax=Luteibacter sp. TaxID=1886636 RepID=UPI002F4110E3